MAFDPKELKKLAKACREAGIKSYKADGLEFTLSDEPPAPSPYKKRKASAIPEALSQPDNKEIETDGWDSMSEEQKLFYSSRDPLFENADEDKH